MPSLLPGQPFHRALALPALSLTPCRPGDRPNPPAPALQVSLVVYLGPAAVAAPKLAALVGLPFSYLSGGLGQAALAAMATAASAVVRTAGCSGFGSGDGAVQVGLGRGVAGCRWGRVAGAGGVQVGRVAGVGGVQVGCGSVAQGLAGAARQGHRPCCAAVTCHAVPRTALLCGGCLREGGSAGVWLCA